MNTLIRPCRVGFALVLTCSAALLPAAEKAPDAPATALNSNSPGYNLEIVDGQLVRPGPKTEATLSHVVDALRDHYSEANIILSPGLAKVKVGDLKLRAGRLVEELEAVRVATGDKFEVQAPGFQSRGVDPSTGQLRGELRPVNEGLFVLREVTPPAQRQRVVEAVNIAPYLEWLRHQPKEAGYKGTEENYGPEQVQTIIRQTLADFNDGPDNAEQQLYFQYHPGASLLIIIGKVDSVEIARKIVNALPGMSSGIDAAKMRFGSPTGEAARERTADDAFRARYGLMPRSAPPAQPGTDTPETTPPK